MPTGTGCCAHSPPLAFVRILACTGREENPVSIACVCMPVLGGEITAAPPSFFSPFKVLSCRGLLASLGTCSPFPKLCRASKRAAQARLFRTQRARTKNMEEKKETPVCVCAAAAAVGYPSDKKEVRVWPRCAKWPAR